jgi:WD40 repeat protein
LIVIWDTKNNCNVIGTLSGSLSHGVSHVTISGDGKYLAASGMDPNHVIVIYDLEKIIADSP